MLEQLRKFNKDNTNLEEMMSLSAFAKGLRAEYETRSIPVPEWLTSSLTTLGHEITSKTRDQLEKRKRELMAQASGLESAEEKRKRIAKELQEIDAQLGVPSPQPVAG
jgi:signal transduction histidine kinase